MATPLDELKKHKNKIINLIYESQEVIGLLADKQDIDLSSKEAESICENNIMDFLYVVDTQLQERALVLVDIEMPKRISQGIKQLKIFIQIICHKDNMKLNGWKSIIGNKRDNLACYIADLIDGNQNLGIGKIYLQGVYPFPVPAPYTGLELEFLTDGFVKGSNYGG